MFSRLMGGFGVVLGVLGIALAIVAIVGTWWLSGLVTTQVLRLFPPVETALAFGDQTAAQFELYIDEAQNQLNTTADAKPIATGLADEIARAQMWVEIATHLLTSIEPTLAQFTRAERLNATLNEAIVALDSTETLALQIQSGRSEAIETLNAELDLLGVQTTALQSAIDDTRNDVAALKQRVPRGVNLAALGVSLVFVWFGIAQYTLLRSGWRLTQDSRAT